MDYEISSRDYLQRARLRLDEGTLDSLFYAALELRSGIEARMSTYLEGQKFVSKKLKKGWQIAKLAKGLEKAFQNNEKIVRMRFFKPEGTSPIYTLFYTPITPKLKKQGEKLGNYLHSMKKFKKSSDPSWEKLRLELESIFTELKKVNYGTLLGPPMMHKRTQRIEFKGEFPGPRKKAAKDAMDMKHNMPIGGEMIVKVDHLSQIPERAH